jgi:hypothetical protein
MKVVVTIAMLLSVTVANAHKLPLDHGPRATSTPWLNQHIREREAAQKQQRQPAAAVQASAASDTAKH